MLPPFHLMPRGVLSGTCNAVLRSLVPRLLDAFVRSLKDDYKRWSADPGYRHERAAATRALGGPPGALGEAAQQ